MVDKIKGWLLESFVNDQDLWDALSDNIIKILSKYIPKGVSTLQETLARILLGTDEEKDPMRQ